MGRVVALPALSSLRSPAVGRDDLTIAVTAGWLTGGLILTAVLHRSGHRQICHVLRHPAGFVLWAVFTLHLWSRRFDPVRVVAGWLPP
jgi:hypothetical protein